MFFIDIHESHSSILKAHIEKYSFRKSVSLNSLSEVLGVHATYSDVMTPDDPEGSSQKWTDIDEPLQVDDDEDTINIHGYSAFIDPRACCLGSRTIIADNALELDKEIVQKPTEFYNNFRRLSGICEGKSVVGQIAHILNFHKLNSISFTKGCYTGQELIARTHSQGVLRTATLPFIISDTLEKFTESVHAPIALIDESYTKNTENLKIIDEKGASIGQIIENDKNIGIAKIKLENAHNYGFLPDGSKLFFWEPVWMKNKSSS